MKFRKVFVCCLMAGAITLTGCGLDFPGVGALLTEQEEEDEDRDRSEDDEEEDDEDREDREDEDEDKDKDRGKDQGVPLNEKKDAKAKELLEAFLADEVEAIRVKEDGSEETFMYSDLPKGDDGWTDYKLLDDHYADLDNDGAQELMIYGPNGGMYLDARDGKVIILAEGEELTGFLTHGIYEGKEYVSHRDATHRGTQRYSFEEYNEKGELVDEFEISVESPAGCEDMTYTTESTFTFRGEKITMEEYEDIMYHTFMITPSY